MDAGAEQSLTARTFPPKLLVGRRFVSSQLRQTSNDGGLRFCFLQGERSKLTSAQGQHTGPPKCGRSCHSSEVLPC